MFTHLFIQNYIFIQKLDIDFYNGFTVITGETGAGKSILIDAINLLLGEKADTSIISDTSKKCIIEGTVNVEKLLEPTFFDELELDYEPLTTIRKEISASGKSRAFINDTPVTLSTLRRFTEQIIDIHSQHAQFFLSQKKYQLSMLDQLAGTVKDYQEYQKLWKIYGQLRRELNNVKEKYELALKEKDYYTFLIQEIDALNVSPDEEIMLEEELQILRNATSIKEDLHTIQSLLQYADNAVIPTGYAILRIFDNVLQHFSSIGSLRERFHSCLVEMNDITQEITRLQERISVDPIRLQQLEQRYDSIHSLLFKHKIRTTRELLQIRNQFEAFVQDTDHLSDKLSSLENEIKRVSDTLHHLAQEISEKRKKVIPLIEKQIEQILRDLSIPHAKFSIHLTQKENLSDTGYDDIQMLFSANKGEEARPLEKIASGGEMSRVMLALKATMAQNTSLPVLLFDEIDSGVSGEVAKQMARIFKQMSEKMQIIVITHLPQIAAVADHHIKVLKDQSSHKTQSSFYYLNEEEKIYEIATMLSGNQITETTLQIAREMRHWVK